MERRGFLEALAAAVAALFMGFGGMVTQPAAPPVERRDKDIDIWTPPLTLSDRWEHHVIQRRSGHVRYFLDGKEIFLG